ncbi:MAG: SGNH/GDSL hydrolase family protein [Reyranella sp.]
MKAWLVRHVGLSRPYRFERTIAVAVALLLATAGGAIVLVYGLADDIAAGSPAAWFFAYVGGLLALGIACAPWPRITMVVLSLAALELGIGLGAAVMAEHGRGAAVGLFPDRGVRSATRVWHPLLQAANVPTPAGTRTRFHVDSQGLRGRERSPAELKDRIVIAVFGGSTTENIALSDGETWPERLETLLGSDRFAVLNRAVSGNGTVQHVIRTAFYQDAYGVAPRCAVYYVGGQDISNSHVRNLDPGYAEFHTPNLVDAVEARYADRAPVAVSPILRLLRYGATSLLDTVRPAEDPAGSQSALPDPALEAIFTRNIRSISAINRARGVRTVWIGELLNQAPPPSDIAPQAKWTLFIDLKDLHRLLAHLRSVLKREAVALGDIHIDLDDSKLEDSQFVDIEHFSAEGAQAFATMIAPTIAAACGPAQ